LDRALLYDLADIALTAAKRNGASYADVIGETRCEYAAKDDRGIFDERACFGMRVRRRLLGILPARGGSVRRACAMVERGAGERPRVKRIQFQPIALERLPAHEAEWIMPMGIDPLKCPPARGRPAADHRQRARHGAGFCSASLSAT
jgi:TldD protein